MRTTELKRYRIKPERWEDFLAAWDEIVVVRRRYGFGVLFALADREDNIFLWAIDHEGDFDAAAERYYRDPERKQLETINDMVESYEIRKVESLAHRIKPSAGQVPGAGLL